MAAAKSKIQIACLSIPDFPLQLSMRALPADFQLPVALIDRSDVRSTVVAVDERAKKRGIYPGLLYARAAALCPELHAVQFSQQLTEHVHCQIIRHLCEFTPAVEPVPEQPGAYYLDVRGLHRLHPDLLKWGKQIQITMLKQHKLRSRIVIGFSRFAVHAVCSTENATVMFESSAQELKAAAAVPLVSLSSRSNSINELAKLGVHTVGDLQKLPPWEVRCRFSEDLYNLVRKSNQTGGAVRGIQLPDPYQAHIELDYPQDNADRLVDAIRQLCTPLLQKMRRYAEGVREIRLQFTKDFGGVHLENLKTAEPTLDETVVMDLLRLKLHAIDLEEKIVAVSVHILAGALPDPQQNLCEQIAKSGNTLAAANRALARIATEFGSKCVWRFRCVASHLPEDSFAWEPLSRIDAPAAASETRTSAVRRILTVPVRIPTPQRSTLHRVLGPYSVSGLWWRQTQVDRREYFVEAQCGTAHWIFYDQLKRQWFRRGFVE